MSDDAAFQKIDEEKLAQSVAEKVKADAIKAAQSAMIEKLQGNKPRFSWEEKGKAAPSDYDELFSEVEKRIPKVNPEDIDQRVEQKLQEKEEARIKQEEQAREQEIKTIEQKRVDFDREWYQLVDEGKLPKVAPEIQERINKGEKLTREEIEADEGLSARLKLAVVAQQTGKSAKIAYYEDYDKQPAGASAPVLGGRPAAATHGKSADDFDYSEVVKERKRLFNY